MVPQMLRPAQKRIWSGAEGQSRDSRLGRSGLGGGDTDAKKGISVRLTEPRRGTTLSWKYCSQRQEG